MGIFEGFRQPKAEQKEGEVESPLARFQKKEGSLAKNAISGKAKMLAIFLCLSSLPMLEGCATSGRFGTGRFDSPSMVNSQVLLEEIQATFLEEMKKQGAEAIVSTMRKKTDARLGVSENETGLTEDNMKGPEK